MLVLFETPAGYAIFKLLNEHKLEKTDNLFQDFETPEAASRVIKLKHFEKFANTTEALAATTAAVEGKLCKSLKKLLKNQCSDLQGQLAVADAKLGNAIKDKLNLSCVSNTHVQELMRCIRSQMDSLLAGFPKTEMSAMALGLAHSLSRYKLKFSPDKIDTMIVQAISLLDSLDKQINNNAMRTREWYGWHFPELGKLISDNVAFAKTVKIIGTRENTSSCDLSDILPEEVEEKVKEAAEISMGTEISDLDIIQIQGLCDQVIEFTEYRTHCYDYLKARMFAMAPNLTVIMGDLIGARLISHAGSLINLAKVPASTLQLLGAEKALFRALKTKKDTPKYGLVYHAQLVGQCSAKNKGKMARMLSSKASLAIRIDAFGEDDSFDFGAEHKAKLEAKLRILEEGNLRRLSGTGKAKAKFEKYHSTSEVIQYPAAIDSTLPAKRRHSEIEATPEPKKKKIKENPEEEADVSIKAEAEEQEESSEPKKKKKKKKDRDQEEAVKTEMVTPKKEVEESCSSEKKKKKKKKLEETQEELAVPDESVAPSSEKKKKKKKKSHSEDPDT